MIVIYTGRRGSGKTTSLVKDTYMYYTSGWDIITNMHSLKIPCEVMDNDDILNLIYTDRNNFVLVLDEIQTFIDSRRSMRKDNVSFTYFIQQIRKRNVTILATSQFSRRVDLAFREHVDVEARPKFYKEYPVISIRYIDTFMVEEGFFSNEEEDIFIDCVFNPQQIYPLFDTEEVILPTEREES